MGNVDFLKAVDWQEIHADCARPRVTPSVTLARPASTAADTAEHLVDFSTNSEILIVMANTPHWVPYSLADKDLHTGKPEPQVVFPPSGVGTRNGAPTGRPLTRPRIPQVARYILLPNAKT